MLSSSYVAENLKDLLHQDGRITFSVVNVEQDFFGYQVKDADGNTYAPITLFANPIPPIMDFYTTRALSYTAYIKFLESDMEVVEDIILNALESEIDGNKWRLSTLNITSKDQADYGFDKVEEYIGNFTVTIYVPMFVTGQDIIYKINGVEVDVVGSSGLFNKAIIPNRPYGNNTSDVATGDEITLNLPIGTSTSDILLDVINKTYNKQYTLLIDYVFFTHTHTVVLTGGSYNFDAGTNALTFNATFTRALPRTTIKINNTTVNVMGFTPSMAISPITKQEGSKQKARAESFSTRFAFSIENDGSQVVNDVVGQIVNHTNEPFTVEWTFNGSTFTKQCIVEQGNIPSSENPNAIITVVMVEGAFYGA